jgi:PAS domain S-box-containing protein
LLEAQERADMGSFLWDLKQGHSVYTPGVAKIFELDGKGTLDEFMLYVHEDDRPLVQQALDKAFEKDGLYECEYRYIRNRKEKRIWSRGTVTFTDGQPASMKGSIMDVSGKYNLLQRLQESEDANKLAQAITHIGNWQWDINSNEISWSDEMYRIYGLQPQSENISFERFLSLIHPDDRDQRLQEIQESMETLVAKDYVMRIVTPEGITKVLKGRGELIVSKDRRPLKLIGTCQDITTEHLLHEELQEKEKYLQELINSAPDAIVVIDENSKIKLWNPKSEEIFGWPASEAIGRPLTETIIPENYRKGHHNGLARLVSTGIPRILNRTLELTAVNQNGVEFPISLTVSQSTQHGQSSFIAFIRDITDDKQTKAELNSKKQQLEKMNMSLESKNNELVSINKELESFNYIASHDLQEPLRKIQTFIQLIIEKGKDKLPPSTVEYFNKITTSSARMKLLIEDLLMFSQATATEDKFEFADLNTLLDEAQYILSTVIEEKTARIESDKLPELRVIPFQIQQLFLNLVSNAIKYSHENQPPVIRISSKTVTGTAIDDSKAVASASYFEIKIQDNGIGFDEENAEKIFGLFQRLHNKDKYSGTGIGLAICKKIVNNHHGFIRASSTPGKGSAFYVYLPMEAKAPKTSYLVN